MRTTLVHKLIPAIFIAIILHKSAFAQLNSERSLEVRSSERDGENSIRIFLSAFERDGEKKFPITTLDTSSFLLSVDGKNLSQPNFSLTTFSASRKWNTRAVVWIYDASGVKTLPNLTRELRILAAQEFPLLQSEFLSITGVAARKNYERVLLDPQNHENTTALQRQLTADNISLKSSAISENLPVCHAARRFTDWQNLGLRSSDQKTLILMGGSVPLSEVDKKNAAQCAQLLENLGVVIHQIVFARPENYDARLWIPTADKKAKGSTHRVINLGGASRALQTIRSYIDNEYILSATLSEEIFRNSRELVLGAKYHGSVFQSEVFRAPSSPSPGLIQSAAVSPLSRPPRALQSNQQHVTALTRASALAFDAWLEWLVSALCIGIFVTIRHVQRMNSGVIEISQRNAMGDVSSGPLLIILNGRDKGREFRIRQQKTILGKGWTCDIRLQPLNIRNTHGELEIQGDKAILRDLSEGELFVNGRAVRSLRAIGHGAVIRLGDLQILFQCGET